MKTSSFSPEWLEGRLEALLPAYPEVELCVALSGGVDSVVLLAALAARGSVGSRKRPALRAVHVHHGLHANADQWTAHCRKLAARLHVPLTVARVKVARPRGASLEAAAREARYTALAEHLRSGEVLLTAHHADDQLETVFLQLLRGAGIAGLAAMPEVARFGRGTLARPLLTRSRAELEAWARDNALGWIEDATNADEQLDRNYLRHRVLPLIRERWPSAARAVSRSARHAAEAKRLLDALALADVERASNGPELSVQQLRALPADRRRNAVRFWIARAGHALPDTPRLDEITRTLLNARPDANPHVDWPGTRIQRHADRLSIQTPDPLRGSANGARTQYATGRRGDTGDEQSASSSATPANNEAIAWNWRAHAQLSLSSPRGTLSLRPDPHGPVNLDALPDTLTVRSRRGGERLRPTRGGRTKTLKSLLQEARVPLAERAALPLLFGETGCIAVADRWLDASIQAAPGTRRRARLHWQAAVD